jgi:hypothetical protein
MILLFGCLYAFIKKYFGVVIFIELMLRVVFNPKYSLMFANFLYEFKNMQYITVCVYSNHHNVDKMNAIKYKKIIIY